MGILDNYIAGQYRRPSGIVGRWIGEKMAEQHRAENLWTVRLLDVRPSDRVLEIGFGPGRAIEEIAKNLTTGQIAGVDFSRTMVSAAKRRNAAGVRAARVDLRYGDVTQLPFADNFFDKVFSINCVYFWTDPAAALEEIRRVLKPGGVLIVTLLPTERWDNAPAANETFRPYSLVELRELFSRLGYLNIQVVADINLANRSNCSVVGQKA
jgi:ubiquinone/menaquinone biosynthesis C-methylase UbiE